jgi:hypothetical protein
MEELLLVSVDGDTLTVNVDGGIRYLIHDQMPKIVEMLCPCHLKEDDPNRNKYPDFFGTQTSVVGMKIQYKIDRRGKLVEVSPWPKWVLK